jgi:hypothetical protein
MKLEKRNFLAEKVVWRKGPDTEHPYEAKEKGAYLLIRLNDFPAENLYTLLVDQREVANFDDWPPNWEREQTDANNTFLSSPVQHALEKI